MITLSIKKEIKIPKDNLWNLLGNFERSLSSGINVKLEKKGNPESKGVGAIRTVTIAT